MRGLRISTFIFSLALVYFAVHFFIGQQGLLSWRAYVQRADILLMEKQALVAKRQLLSDRLARLSAASADADYIEERAFSQLGLVHPGDFVIPLPEAAK
ncbi:MAG: septum formation initiator family protein [Hyphomonadaceae bacterium]|nr:septum formation initiator family protein [Hyphomonadaceae bacterium]